MAKGIHIEFIPEALVYDISTSSTSSGPWITYIDNFSGTTIDIVGSVVDNYTGNTIYVKISCEGCDDQIFAVLLTCCPSVTGSTVSYITIPTTPTPTPTLTATPTSTMILTPTPTLTATPTSTMILTPTPTLTATPTSTMILTPTPTVTQTSTPTLTNTPSTLPCAVFNTFSSGHTINYSGSDGYQEVVSSGTVTINCNNTNLYLHGFSGTGGSTTQGTATIINVLGTGYGNYALNTTTLGPGGGIYVTIPVTIALSGTYNVVLNAIFNPGTNPPTLSNYVSLSTT